MQLFVLLILIVSFTCLGRISPRSSLKSWQRSHPWHPHHAQGSFGHSSVVAEEGERVPETGVAGGVCRSTPGQHAAHCGGYVWGAWRWGFICSGSQRTAHTLLEFSSEGTGEFFFLCLKTQRLLGIRRNGRKWSLKLANLC